ncbi:hypothetical protein [Paramaledivibacter caminithermalis]|uniref:Uncharacterized protein n=1 Tax=Paramaledivibacter caminithermalis (strain DSM 15212 / CIP 107654 / DViRD3) TaxID=1121301 RepID=A0A1M6K5E2_PARC5|nr:hypothetical protein [Paramaledivibacter caminithermalis]SHJ54117.1 hypothetical protein SAMN02745912_00268 [Paramaledivibacter caminithermalis DSM 15212]
MERLKFYITAFVKSAFEILFLTSASGFIMFNTIKGEILNKDLMLRVVASSICSVIYALGLYYLIVLLIGLLFRRKHIQ